MEALLWRRAMAGPVRPRGTPMTSRHGDPVGARLRQFYAALIDERRLGARRSFFAHAVGKAEQLLFALRRRADDDQDALLGVFKTGLQVNAVGPHVDVALGRQIALLPMLVLVEPDLLQPGDGRSRQTRRILAQQGGKRLLRVYAEPSGAAAKRVGNGRWRPIKDDKRRDGARILLATDRISASLTCRQ